MARPIRSSSGITRRRAITQAAAAVGGGAATLIGGRPAAAQAPAVATGAQSGRQYRALVVRANGGAVETVTLAGRGPDQVVVRTEAGQIDYTIVAQVSSYPVPRIPGHGGVGVVEAVGERVRRVEVGDRVVVANTPYCGQCYTCLRGRPDRCQMLPGAGGNPLVPIGTLADGVEVVQHNNEAGFGELMIAYEWYCIPVFHDVDPVDLSVVGCAGAFGLGTVFGIAPVEPGSDVVVLGCGPCGLSAIQGARIKGASQIIAVEPIPERRALALELGATIALDPNVEGDDLVTRVRELCSGPTDRRFAGGRNPNLAQNAVGPQFVIECVGGDVIPPVIAGPDPTGLQSLQQAWDMCSAAGHVVTGSVFQQGNFSVPAGQWSNGAKNHHPGNMNGVNGLRDIPMYARLISTGQFNARALAPSTYPLDQAVEAVRAVGERTTVGAVLTFQAGA
jgi:S-(hydroxymethyl)glutathione dehydrogenase/alcohol dehydrogenase